MYSKSKAKNIIAAKYERDALITASACYIPFITLIRPYLQEFGQKFSPTPYGMITKLLYQVRDCFFLSTLKYADGENQADTIKFSFSEKATQICAIVLMVLTFTKLISNP